MRKIPTLFVRNPDDRAHVIVGEVTPGCEWVLAGEGVATRKYDGTCVLLGETGNWWARREVKRGKRPPPDFCPEQHDETTGKTVGWEPMAQSPFAKFHAEALGNCAAGGFEAGTYELIGPKVNGNPEAMDGHILMPHAKAQVLTLNGNSRGPWAASDIVAMMTLCRSRGIEGIVWHHPDGRMAKLKVRDLA